MARNRMRIKPDNRLRTTSYRTKNAVPTFSQVTKAKGDSGTSSRTPQATQQKRTMSRGESATKAAGQGAYVPKYQVTYLSNGDVKYGDQTVGNFLQQDIFSVGVDEWLEKWAAENGVKLVENANWLAAQGQKTGDVADKLAPNPGRKVTDASEKAITDTFGVSEAGRVSNQNQNAATSGLNSMLPINTGTGVRGLAKMSSLDKGDYGKGFEPEAMNPFYTK